MTNYEKGGLASVAQSLAKEGRNGDTELVHMSPKEVRGLQALATANGSSLTINPTTGLPEAFNFRLENLIPMAAGAALTATGVGAPIAALMVGGAYGAATGSIEKGLMAGIGAYGGAGLASGLAEAGASSMVESAATPTVTGAGATGAGSTGAAAPVGDVFAGYSPTGSSAGMAGTTVGTTGSGAASAAQNAINAQAMPNYSADQISSLKEAALRAENPMDVVRSANMGNVAQSSQIVNPTFEQSLSNMGAGIKNLGTQQGLASAYGAMPTGTLPATGISLLTAAQPRPSSVPGYQEDQYDRRLKGYRLSPNYQPYVAPTPNPYYRPVYAAEGGAMSSFDDEPGKDMAHGGVASLGGYSDGGRMLRGPGDGMSDSIPGIIGGRQPARLADGEFVVPADVVSHLGNGSTEAGAKKLYGMMDKIRQARTGKKRQAPEIKADRYLPMKKMASGGITSYAEGGSTNSNKDVVTKIYQEQLGREPDAEGLKFWSDALANGAPISQIVSGINQSVEGQNFDTQYITSLYRQNLARNPEQAGFQWWLSLAQDAGYTPTELNNMFKTVDDVEQVARGIQGQTFTEMELADLEADPYGGRYATQSIYDIAPDAINLSRIGSRQAQFVSPVTQQPVISGFGGGQEWTQKQGLDVLNSPAVQAAISRAVNSGAMTKTEYDTLNSDVRNAKSMDDLYTAFNKPKAQVVVDALYGQQMGEAQTLAAAKAEAEQRQAVLNAVDTGYYQANPQLAAQYEAAGLNYPFGQEAYQGYDTRTTQANVVTPANFQEQRRLLANEMARTPIYKPTYQTINRAGNMPEYVLDPYSDAGLTYLYGRMMNQYNPPAPGFINPATAPYNTPTGYIPPALNNLVLNTPVPDAANPAPAPVVAEAPVADGGGGSGG